MRLPPPLVLALSGCNLLFGDPNKWDDSAEPACEAPQPLYRDQDGDGYGDPDRLEDTCPGAGWVDNGDDCDDEDPGVNPDATEVCDDDDIDEDCNGLADNADPGADLHSYWVDADGDGYGDPDGEMGACERPEGYVDNDDDCDDDDDGVNPGAVEVCDGGGVDEDCDGRVDDDDPSMSSSGLPTWYADDDGDGYGDPDSTTQACERPRGYVSNGEDCDDTDAAVNPDGQEVCDDDGVDEDCDGLVNDDDPSMSTTGLPTYYPDEDGDGYGSGSKVPACDASTGFSSNDDDCDDTDASINPAATEVCNDGADNDCDGTDNGCSLDGSYDVSAAPLIVTGTASDFLYSVAGVGDQDGDGIDDLLAGAYYAGAGGEAYLFGGRPSGKVSTASADATFTNSTSGSLLATTLLGNFDWDADGDPDFAIGDFGETRNGRTGAGATYIFFGPRSTDATMASADRTISGPSAYSYVSRYMAGGDWDGDGNDDLASVDQVAWEILIELGPFSSGSATVSGDVTIEADDLTDVRLGDANGDGADDLLAGYRYYGSTYKGQAWFLEGGSGSGTLDLISGADASFAGTTDNGELGAMVDFCDLDDDGVADAVAGAGKATGGATTSGAAYVWFATLSGSYTPSSADVSLLGDARNDYFGFSVRCAGDVNLDDHDDLLVTAPYDDDGGSSSGTAFLWYGPLSGSIDAADADVIFVGDDPDDLLLLGEPVGDVDGDGAPDLALGSSTNNTGGAYAGALWVFSGGGY